MNNRWEELDKQYLWHPFTQMQGWCENEQLVIERAQGVKLIDVQGKEYYDGVSSLWVNLHGHRHPTLDAAIKAQLDKVAHTTMLGLINQPASEYAKRLVEVLPKGLTKVFYSDDGSTAVEVALKMAFQYWQHKGQTSKQKFIALANAYHGDTIGTVSVGGIDLFHRVFKPMLFTSKYVPSPSCYHCHLVPENEKSQCGQVCLQQLEAVLKEHHQELAGMIIEPLVQAAAGMLTQPKGYLKAVRELTKKYNVLLIADEVATGFGRTGKMFACMHEDVTPDMITLSKGITGGYMPLAVTATTDEIYQAFLGAPTEYKTFYHGHSYTGNPLACAAAIASLDVFAEENVLENLQPKIEVLRQGLEKFKSYRFIGEIRQCGTIVGIELMLDKAQKTPFPPEKLMGGGVCQKAREYGLIIRNIGDVVILMLPLAATSEDIVKVLEMLDKAFQDVFADITGENYSDPCAF